MEPIDGMPWFAPAPPPPPPTPHSPLTFKAACYGKSKIRENAHGPINTQHRLPTSHVQRHFCCQHGKCSPIAPCMCSMSTIGQLHLEFLPRKCLKCSMMNEDRQCLTTFWYLAPVLLVLIGFMGYRSLSVFPLMMHGLPSA